MNQELINGFSGFLKQEKEKSSQETLFFDRHQMKKIAFAERNLRFLGSKPSFFGQTVLKFERAASPVLLRPQQTVGLFSSQGGGVMLNGEVLFVSKEKLKVLVPTQLFEELWVKMGESVSMRIISSDEKISTQIKNFQINLRLRTTADILNSLCEFEPPSQVGPSSGQTHRALERSNLSKLLPEDFPLSEKQLDVAASALVASPFCVIDGGPGTGKTRVCAAIAAALRLRDRVLLLSRSESAAERIADFVKQISPEAKLLSLARPALHRRLKRAVGVSTEFQAMKQELAGLQNAPVEKNSKACQARARRIGVLQRDIAALEEEIFRQILADARIVYATPSQLYNVRLNRLFGLRAKFFEVAIFDDALLADEFECWPSLLLANRVVVSGDSSLYLPPAKTSSPLFSRMIARSNPENALTRQFRMDPELSALLSSAFYWSRLSSEVKVIRPSPSILPARPGPEAETANGPFVVVDISSSSMSFKEKKERSIKQVFLNLRANGEKKTIAVLCENATDFRNLDLMFAKLNLESEADQLPLVILLEDFEGDEADVVIHLPQNEPTPEERKKDEKKWRDLKVRKAFSRARRLYVAVVEKDKHNFSPFLTEIIKKSAEKKLLFKPSDLGCPEDTSETNPAQSSELDDSSRKESLNATQRHRNMKKKKPAKREEKVEYVPVFQLPAQRDSNDELRLLIEEEIKEFLASGKASFTTFRHLTAWEKEEVIIQAEALGLEAVVQKRGFKLRNPSPAIVEDDFIHLESSLSNSQSFVDLEAPENAEPRRGKGKGNRRRFFSKVSLLEKSSQENNFIPTEEENLNESRELDPEVLWKLEELKLGYMIERQPKPKRKRINPL